MVIKYHIYFNFFLVCLLAIIAVYQGSLSPPSPFQLSDLNYKNNIRYVDQKEIPKIFNLVAKAFTVKADKPPLLKYGYIAQEIEKEYPNMVIELNKRKYVDLTQLIPLIIETLKSNRQEFLTLKTDIEELKKASAKTAVSAAKT